MSCLSQECNFYDLQQCDCVDDGCLGPDYLAELQSELDPP